MAKNDFKAFAVNEDANVLSQEEYEALEALGAGFQSGIARSEQLNKVWRQASVMSAALADFIATQSGNDVIDDGDLVKIRASLLKALLAYSINQLDSRYLNIVRNLSDLKDVPAARKSLGLKGAALLDVGATSGTVAAGNDSRIVNAVPNKRKINGHPLTDDFDLSAADVKALAVTTIRAQRDPSTGNVADANNLPANAVSFVYGNAGNTPKFTGSLLDFSGLGGGYNTQIAADYNSAGARAAFRTRNGDSKIWNPWYEFFHEGNKPTPDVIFPLSGNIGNAQNLNNYTTPGLYYQSANAQASSGANYPEAVAGSLEIYKHAGITQIYRTYNGSRQYIRTLYAGTWTGWAKVYDTANKPSPGEIGALAAGGTAVAAAKLATARTIAGVAFDGQSNIGIPAGNVGAYTKAEVNNLVNARGAKSTASLGVNGWHRDGDTGFIMQWGQVGGGVGNVSITFPIPFPNACRSMSNTVMGDGGGDLNWSTVRTTSRTGASIGRDHNGAFWQAWGY